jgi:hypothetical protein
MPVYVDNFYETGVTFRGMKMSHMMADTTEELLAMVDKIGVQRKWIQDAGTSQEHFDVALEKRTLAIKHGAIEVGMRALCSWAVKGRVRPLSEYIEKLKNR